MQKIGYSLVALATAEEVMTRGSLPWRVAVEGVGVVDFDQPGQVIPDSNNPTHILVERWAEEAPTSEHTLASEVSVYDEYEARVNVSRTWSDPLAPTKAELFDYAAAHRWNTLEVGAFSVEIGGTQISVPTNESTRNIVTAGYVKALANPSYQISKWKVAPNLYVSLNSATILAIGDALEAHVQEWFDTNELVDAAIAAETITTYAQIDAAAWPGGA